MATTTTEFNPGETQSAPLVLLEEGDAALTYVRSDTLKQDPRYQRPVKLSKVKRIAREFNPRAFGVLYVAERANGDRVLLDGLQRNSALEMKGWGATQVPAIVYTGLTDAEEADLFVRYNDLRTKPRPNDLYKAALMARDPDVMLIQTILDSMGLTVGDGPKVGNLQAVSTVRRVYANAGPQVFERTLRILTRAWGTAKADALNGNVMYAVAAVVHRHDPDDDRLVTVLADESPVAILRKARTLKADLSGVGGGHTNLAGTIGGIIVTLYNKNLTGAARIDWEPELTGKAFWRPVSMGLGETRQRRANAEVAERASSKLTTVQLRRAYALRAAGVRWPDILGWLVQVNPEAGRIGLTYSAARDTVIRWAKTAGLESLTGRVITYATLADGLAATEQGFAAAVDTDAV